MRAQEQIELIKSLKMPPDFIINIKVCLNASDGCRYVFSLFKFSPLFTQCADKDLVERLAGLKQLPENGQLFTRSQWQREVTSYRIWDGEDDMDGAKEDENEANVSLKKRKV